jgi:hypothetical protein
MGARGAGRVAVVGMMLLSLAGCGGNDQGRLTAVGWTSNGDVVLVRAHGYGEAAALSTGRRGGRMHTASLDRVCYGPTVMSVFAAAAPGVGLVVSCGGNDPRVAFVSFDPQTGQAQSLAAVSQVNLPRLSSFGSGIWSEADRSAVMEYTTLGCSGVGTLTGGEVHPLDVEVVLSGSSIHLADALPEVGGAGCEARALARAATLSPHGRYLAFFIHMCDPPCDGPMPDARPGPVAVDGIWRIVVQDRVDGTATVLDAEFRWPSDTALTDDGVLVISAERGGAAGLYQCRITACATPMRLASGRFGSVQIRPDGAELIALRQGADEPVFVPLQG